MKREIAADIETEFPDLTFPMNLVAPRIDEGNNNIVKVNSATIEIKDREVLCHTFINGLFNAMSLRSGESVSADSAGHPNNLAPFQAEGPLGLHTSNNDVVLRYDKIKFGSDPKIVSRVLADMPMDVRSNETSLVHVGSNGEQRIVIEAARRRKKAKTSDDYAWQLTFDPPAPAEFVNKFMQNLTFMMRLASGLDVNWTRVVQYHDGAMLQDEFYARGLPSLARRRERIWLTKIGMERLMQVAGEWMAGPPKICVHEAINLLNQIEGQDSYLSLKMAGIAVLFERLALSAARQYEVQKGWQFDPANRDLISGRTKKGFAIFVPIKEKMLCLFDAAGIQMKDDAISRICEIRNDTLHGKDIPIDETFLYYLSRALGQLIFLLILGILKFDGKFVALGVYLNLTDFPAKVGDEIKAIEDLIMQYPL